jgi:hypothetical protein
MTPTTDTNGSRRSCTWLDPRSAPRQATDSAGHFGRALQAEAHLTADQAWTNPGRLGASPSNQLSNNRHVHHRTLVDVDGRSFPDQTDRSPGSPCRDLASGRRGRLRCRIWP